MNDAMTRSPLRVSTDGKTAPYIMAPVSQIDDLRQLHDNHRIGYWMEEVAISFAGAPEISINILGHGTNATAIQAILESVE